MHLQRSNLFDAPIDESLCLNGFTCYAAVVVVLPVDFWNGKVEVADLTSDVEIEDDISLILYSTIRIKFKC